jgi:hypothetical protein
MTWPNKIYTFRYFLWTSPTKGSSDEERRITKEVNLKLINLMITEIPNESKFCVSYGQLKVAIGPFLLLQHKVPQRGDKIT